MRPQGPTFWLLDGITGWRTAWTDQVAVSTRTGIRLMAVAAGPLALNEQNGSLGGLVLPQGMALDAGLRLYLLNRQGPWIKRFEPEQGTFVPLPTLGGTGETTRLLDQPVNIAIAGNNLYVAERGGQRVQVFDLNTLALRYHWERDATDPWDPIDVAAAGELAFILDYHGRVYRHRVGSDRLELLIEQVSQPNCWARIAVDRERRLYLLDLVDPNVPRLEIYTANGQRLGQATDAGELDDRFDAPPIRLDYQGRFYLPEGLSRPCHRQVSPVTAPTALRFDRRGNPVAPSGEPEPAGPPTYQRSGAWISEVLDSRIYDCQWHRIDLDLERLPAGTQVRISTYTDNQRLSLEQVRALDHWQTRYTVTGPQQPAAVTPTAMSTDVLVQSPLGQHLWVRLELRGDGYATPLIRALRVHYPRDSYLRHLPAVFSADDAGHGFLERFLSLFQVEWDALEQRIEDMARYFDPNAVPSDRDGAFLDYLAQWLALPLEQSWDVAQQRRLLAAAPSYYTQRGTWASLRHYLRLYLHNLTGIDPDRQRDYPFLLEGWRQRNYLLLTGAAQAALGRQYPLWSPAKVGRLQLDQFAQEGQVRLVSTGDPERDVFHVHAHCFQVYLPAAWVRSAADERLLRRALDAEKPAHTDYGLCLVEPRLRVGIQSTVGIDTIIGDYPLAILAGVDQSDIPPSQAPRQRLGYDTVLAGRPASSVEGLLPPRIPMGTAIVLS
jgi:phage tail-like protein